MVRRHSKTRFRNFFLFFVSLAILIGLFFRLTAPAAEAAWADDSYSYRQHNSFTHNASVTSARAITFTLDTAELISANLMQNDCDDLLITTNSGAPLRYHLTGVCNNASTTYEVEFPTTLNGTNTFYIYYANPTATSQTDITVSNVTALTPSGGDPSSSNPTATDEQGVAPISYWSMDESDGSTLNDYSTSSNNDLTITNAIWKNRDVCLFNSCLYFDGNGDYATKTYSSDTELLPSTESFTVSAWFKHSTTLGADTLISRADGVNGVGWKVYMNGSGYMCFGVDADAGSFPNDDACTNTSQADGTWHQVVAVKNGTTNIQIYLDGVLLDTQTSITNSSLDGTNAAFTLGNDADNGTNGWVGFIDEVKYSNFAKSANQIKVEYASKSVSPKNDTATLGSNNSNLTQGLIGYWPLDESSWTNDCSTTATTDSSGNGYTATSCPNSTGPTGGAAGKFGRGGSFDGSDDYLALANPFSVTDSLRALTVSAWIKPNFTTSESTDRIFFFNGAINFRFNATVDDFSFTLSTSDDSSSRLDTSGISFTQNTWHHIVGTYDGKTQSIYWDGVLVASTPLTGTLSSAGEGIIGGHSANATDWLGSLDEVRLYSRSLTTHEVSRLYSWSPEPVLYYKLDENTGTSSVNDTSGGDNTATMNGTMTSDDWVVGKYGSALNFDGADDYLDGGSATNLDNLPSGAGLSISAWIKPFSQGESSAGFIVAKNTGTSPSSGWILQFAGTNALTFTVDGSTDLVRTTSNSVITSDVWNHVEVTWDGAITTASSVHVYINGVEASYATTTNGAARVDDSSSSLYVGSDSTQARTFLGYIDDVKIYNYVRDSKQIIQDFNGGHPTVGSPISSLLGFWRFDENNGQSAANSGYGGASLNGYLGATSSSEASDPTWTNSGKFDGALTFSGGQYVKITDTAALDISGNVTLSAWVKASNTSSKQYIIARWSSPYTYKLGMNGDCTGGAAFEFSVYNGTTRYDACATGAVDTNWHHVLGTYDGTKVYIYIDGKLKNSATATGSLQISGTADVFIGSESGSTSYFNGQLDSVKIYNTSLTAQEVALDYNQESAITLGSPSTNSAGSAPDYSRERAYCPPGDSTSTCAPLGHWKLDENTGTSFVYDASSHDNTGTMTGSIPETAWVTGRSGSGLTFNGSGQYITGSSAVPANFPFTLEGWMKSSVTGITETIIALNDNGSSSQRHRIYIHDVTGRARIQSASTGTNGLTTVNDGNWHYIVGVFNSATDKRLYVDGVLEATQTTSTTYSGIDDWEIGAVIDTGVGAEGYFNGVLDEIKIYDYARTPAQIAWDYNRGSPVAHYKFDECSGDTAYNSVVNANGTSSAGNNGTLNIGSGGTTVIGACDVSATSMRYLGSPGKFNAALDFDAADDRVTITNANAIDLDLGINGGFSLSAWIYADSAGENNQGQIFNKGANTYCRTDNPSGSNLDIECQLDLTTTDRNVNVSAGITTGTWNHLVFSWTNDSDDDVTVWINGQNRGASTTATNDTVPLDSSNLTIGTNGASVSTTFDGRIDDFQIYNYELSAQQVKTLYNQNSAVRFGPQTGYP